jgi:hypothetical protein
MEERRLPGETEAAWNLVRDGEVWTYRVWASPYLPEEIRAFPGRGQVVRMEREVVRKGTGEAAWSSAATRSVPCRRLPGAGSGGTGLGGPPGLSGLPVPPPGGQGEEGGLGGLLLQPPRCPALPGALCGIAVKSGVSSFPATGGHYPFLQSATWVPLNAAKIPWHPYGNREMAWTGEAHPMALTGPGWKAPSR